MIRMCDYSWQKKLLLFSIAAAGMGLAAGFSFYANFEQPVLRFEEPEIDLRASAAIEGESIETIANLRNFSNVPIRIAEMMPS